MRTEEYLNALINESNGMDPRQWRSYIDELSEIERAKALRDAEIERKKNEMKDYNPHAWANTPEQLSRAFMAGYKPSEDVNIVGVNVDDLVNTSRVPNDDRNKQLYDALMNKEPESVVDPRVALDKEIEDLEAQLYSIKNQPGYRAARFDYTVKGDRSGLDKIAQNAFTAYENALNRKNSLAIAGKSKGNATQRDVDGLVKQLMDLRIQGANLKDSESKKLNENAQNYILSQLKRTPEGMEALGKLDTPNTETITVKEEVKQKQPKESVNVEEILSTKYDKNTGIDELQVLSDNLKKVIHKGVDTTNKESEQKTSAQQIKAYDIKGAVDNLIKVKKKSKANTESATKAINDILKRFNGRWATITRQADRDDLIAEANEELKVQNLKGTIKKSAKGGLIWEK